MEYRRTPDGKLRRVVVVEGITGLALEMFIRMFRTVNPDVDTEVECAKVRV